MNAELARQHAHYTAVKRRLATVPPVKTLEPRRWLGRELHTQYDTHVWDYRVYAHDRQTALALQTKPAQILREVSAKYNVAPESVLGTSRVRARLYARQEMAWRLRQETSFSLQQIGRFIGAADHTTALHGIRSHEARMNEGKTNV